MSTCEASTTIIVICRVTSVNRVLAQTDTSSSEFCVIQLIAHLNLNAARLQQILQGYWKAGQGRAGQGRAGQGRAGQGRAGQGRAGQGRAGQGRAGQGRAGQGRAGEGRGGEGRGGERQGRVGEGRGREGGERREVEVDSFCCVNMLLLSHVFEGRAGQGRGGEGRGGQGRGEERRGGERREGQEMGGEGREVEVDSFCCVNMLLLSHVFAVMVTSFKDLKRHKHLFVTIPTILHRVWTCNLETT